jgi:hypothetical protein
LCRVTPTQPFHTAFDLADHEHAQIKVVCRDRR